MGFVIYNYKMQPVWWEELTITEPILIGDDEE
jgi:hypothetical protein